jgi:hypothetical protein
MQCEGKDSGVRRVGYVVVAVVVWAVVFSLAGGCASPDRERSVSGSKEVTQ